jgi:hypothetical protein
MMTLCVNLTELKNLCQQTTKAERNTKEIMKLWNAFQIILHANSLL